MEKHYRVSIIIPIYKVEPFIERCAMALLNQDFDSIEYIFINDATPDNSFKILKDIIKKSPRKEDVRLLENEQNIGLAKTRLRGMLEAQGDFVLNTDSDDWVEPNIVSALFEKISKENTDVAVSDYFVTFTNKEYYAKEIFKKDIDYNIRNILLGRIRPSMWRTLIRREFYLKNKLFPREINMGEDYDYLLRLFLLTSKISYVPKALYHYVQYNSQSITKLMNDSSMQDIIKSIHVFRDIIKSADDKYLEELKTMIVFWKKVFVLDKHYTKYFYTVYPEVNKFKYIFSSNGYGIFQKITLSFMLLRMPFITRLIYRSYRWFKNKIK